MHRLAAICSVLAIVVVGCAGGPGEPSLAESTGPQDSSPEATRQPPATVAVSPSPGDGGTDGVSRDIIDRALDQATADTGVARDEIRVVAAEAVTWRDGSLGCPQPGMGYTQALVPGYRVVLDVDGEQVHYHAAQNGDFFACDNPVAPAETSSR